MNAALQDRQARGRQGQDQDQDQDGHRANGGSPEPVEARRERLLTLLARVRAEQLNLALAGRVIESARFAERARVLRSTLEQLERAAQRCAAAAVVALTLVGPAAAQPATPVRTGRITEEVIQDHRRVTGSLQAVSRSAVAGQEPGLVRTVLVDEGEVVKAGDVIATLDARRLTAQLAEARAEHASQEAIVAQREAEYRFAELDAERVRNAHTEGAASERELSEVQTLLDVRRSQLDAAMKAVDRAVRGIDLLEIRLEDTTLRAPFDARVVARHVEPGEWINPGQPVVTLVSTGLMEARLEIPERFAPAVLGAEHEIIVELGADGRTAQSLSVRPVADIDPRARTFQVFVTLDNSAGLMVPGMSVQAWVPTTDQALALLAPKDAVIQGARDAYVYRVVGSEPEAERMPVKVLFAWKDRLAVTSPELSAGDTVVIEGNERLAPGAPLTLTALDARNN